MRPGDNSLGEEDRKKIPVTTDLLFLPYSEKLFVHYAEEK
jgi:hypothetical protein